MRRRRGTGGEKEEVENGQRRRGNLLNKRKIKLLKVRTG